MPDEQLKALLVMTFEGLVALGTHRPKLAVERLLKLPAGASHSLALNGLLIRADAYRQAGQHAEAERDYRALLKLTPPNRSRLHTPLGLVGLARSLAAQGKNADARAEYQNFLEIWSEADPELTLVREVRTELGKL